MKVLAVLFLLCAVKAGLAVNYAVNPCDAERGEAGARAWCWHCHDAATEAECMASGEYMRCPSPNDICYKFTQVHGENDGSSSDTVKFDRGCKPITACENAALGPDNWACNKDPLDEAMTNCLNCYYSTDYLCTPPNPCPPNYRGQPGKVWCLRCEDEASDKACAAFGEYQECFSSQDVCFRKEQNNSRTGITSVSKGCTRPSQCTNAALGPREFACHTLMNDPETTICKTCDYNVTAEASCEAVPPIACYCWGDPHCVAFGSSRQLFSHGSCWYTLTTDRCPGAEVGTFDVIAKMKHAKTTSDRSFVETVKIMYTMENGEQMSAYMEQGNRVVVTNENVPYTLQVESFPYTNAYFPGIEVLESTDPVTDHGSEWDHSPVVSEIKFNNGMRVLWDGVNKVKIWMKPAMAGHICGICGPVLDYTGDLVVGPHDQTHLNDNTGCPNKASGLPFGALTWDEQEYFNSWYHHKEEEDLNCVYECGGE